MFADQSAAQTYLSGLKVALADGFPEILIPRAAQYNDILDLHVNKALAGEETPQVALDAVAVEWNKITDNLGRDKQIELWLSALAGYRAVGLLK